MKWLKLVLLRLTLRIYHAFIEEHVICVFINLWYSSFVLIFHSKASKNFFIFQHCRTGLNNLNKNESMLVTLCLLLDLNPFNLENSHFHEKIITCFNHPSFPFIFLFPISLQFCVLVTNAWCKCCTGWDFSVFTYQEWNPT